MPRIFISYRREDSQWPTDKIHQAIRPLLVNPDRDLFIDVDNIPLGVNFAEHLENSVAQCDVLLAVIGRDWLNIRSAKTNARRLDDPDDFVRVEIAAALSRGIRVVPVLLDGASVPAAEDLPDNLRELSMRHGLEVRRLSFDADVERLIKGLGLKPRLSPLALFASVAATVVVGLTIVGLFWLATRPASPPASADPVAEILSEPVPGEDARSSPIASDVEPSQPQENVLPPAEVKVAPAPAPVTTVLPVDWSSNTGRGMANNAVKSLDTARVDEILRGGWDPNAALDIDGNAALHTLMSVCEKFPEHDREKLTAMARFLIANGAIRQNGNRFSDTPLRIAQSPKYCGPDHPVVDVLRF